MTSRGFAGLFALLGFVVVAAGCWRANVYPITGGSESNAAVEPPRDAAAEPARDDVPDEPSKEDASTEPVANDVPAEPPPNDAPAEPARNDAPAEPPRNDAPADPGRNDSPSDPSAESVICPSPVLKQADTSISLQVGSLSRSYVLHVPQAYTGKKPVPLILDFHGVGVTGWGELSSSPYPDVTDAEGAIMAFPDGMKGPAGTGWNVGPCCVDKSYDDVAFARAVVADVEKTACIDPNRVYAVGAVTGGGMAYYLACHAADIFAAAAPAAFDLLKENVDGCNPSRPITVISFRGTKATSRVPYEGGASSLVPGMPITFLGAVATFEKWAELDGCTGSPSQEDSHGCSTYSTCQEGVQVTLCTKQGGDADPGDATVAWPWLKRYAL
jgi:polyhydroxybutyrate depolymerase